MSIRFVPDQSASQLVDLLTAHVRHEFAKLRSPNSVAVEVHSTGDWWEAPADSPYMQMAERALHTEWGVEPLLVREGKLALAHICNHPWGGCCLPWTRTCC